MSRKRLRIAVLMGGISDEREVSIASGSAIAEALARCGHDVWPVVLNAPSIDDLDPGALDIAFIALHGRFGEDGQVQALLEKRGIPYTGSGPGASSVGMDKIMSKATFTFYHIPTPPFMEIRPDTPIGDIRDFQLPLVVKPAAQGSSVGVALVRDWDQLDAALETAFEKAETLIVERLIDGKELTVGILGEEALPVIEIIPGAEYYDYEAKYKRDDTQYIVNGKDIDESTLREIQRIALDAHRVIGCRDMSRVDIILSRHGKPYVLEVNTIPGFTSHSLLPKAARASGVSFDELCDRIVQMAHQRALRGGGDPDSLKMSAGLGELIGI